MHNKDEVSASTQQACEALIYSWALAQDSKDRELLLSVFAPIITADYSSIGLPSENNVTAQQHVDGIFSPTLLGRKDIRTQHLIGAQKWSQASHDRIRCEYQINVTQLRVTSEINKTPKTVDGPQSNPHGWNEMIFECVEGQWKIVFLGIHVLWIVGDWDAVFNMPAN